MSLTFTDPQLKELTGQALGAPALVASLISSKAKAIQKKADYLFLDNANEVYTNYYANLMTQYHAELKYLNGQDRANYSIPEIANAGKLAGGNIHFPDSPIWIYFQPKSVNSNLGLPVGAWANTEPSSFAPINTELTRLLTGFTSGAITSATATAFLAGSVEVNSTAFTVGDKVLFTTLGTTDFLCGTVTALDAVPPLVGTRTLSISIIDSFGTIAVGSIVRNFHPGFSNGKREGTIVQTLSEAEYMNSTETKIDAAVVVWFSRLSPQVTALTANDAPAPEKAQITTALADVNTTIGIINTWSALAATGAGVSRFGDTKLLLITNEMTSRTSQFATRIPQITTAFGSVSQVGDGTFTGSGHYFNFFSNVNIRVNKANGTLRNYYQMDLIISTFDQSIAVAQAQADRDSSTFFIKKLNADGNGTATVVLVDSTGLVNGETLKFMSNTQPVLVVQILAISGNNVTLDVIIPSTYKKSEAARLVRVS